MGIKAIAIIPARGGSKRLARKNVLPINSHPMIAYPIVAARTSGLFDRVVVSTEDSEIASVARLYGATVVNRPDMFAQDKSTVVEVCEHVLSLDEYQSVDVFCCLYATAVFLTKRDLIESKQMLVGGEGSDCVMGVSSYSYHPVQALKESDGYLSSMWPEFQNMQSQEYPKLSVSNGTLYWARRKRFLQELSFYGNKLKGYHLEAVDIDTLEDYKKVQYLAKEKSLQLSEK